MFETDFTSDNEASKTKKLDAYLYAIKLLAKRDYSEFKLRKKLIEKSFSGDEIEKAMSEVIEKGYLREDYYAEARIKGFMYKGFSIEHIIQRLAKEHVDVDRETVEKIFSEYGISKESQIQQLIEKKLRTLNKNNPKTRAKILRFLISKGYSYGCCATAISRALSADSDSSETY